MNQSINNSRRPDLQSLQGTEYDVAVVGGGINGCAAAQELAAAGFSVLLAEKGDFAAASSSRSTRLVHCGLRYLAPGGSPYSFLLHPSRLLTALKMTRKAMLARSEFVNHAPQRTRRFTFGFPVWRGNAFRTWHVDLGLRMVSALGPGDVPLDRGLLRGGDIARVPLFRDLRDQDSLTGVNTYVEYQFNWPERVAMDMVLDASRMGAVCLNYTPVSAIQRTSDDRWSLSLRDAADTPPVSVTAKMVINTAGIWIDEVNKLATANAGRKILGTKGAHIVLRLPEEYADHGVMTLNRKGEEPVYLIPWRQGLHYMGVTETIFEGDRNNVQAGDDDIQWLLDELNHLIPSLKVTQSDILYTWAGVRPLTYDPDLPKGARSREIHDLGADGLPNVLAMTAGPITTHRSAGRELRDRVAARLSPSQASQTPDYSAPPIPRDENSPSLLNHDDSVRMADIRHSAANEQVTSLIDLLARRTGLVWTQTCARDGAQHAAEEVAEVLGWDRQRIEAEVAGYLNYIDSTHRKPTIP